MAAESCRPHQKEPETPVEPDDPFEVVVERDDELTGDTYLPPWLWPVYSVWITVAGQWRCNNGQLLAIDLLAIQMALELHQVPAHERLWTVQRLQVIEGEVRSLLESKQHRQGA